MRTIIIVLIVLVAGILGVGFYQGWFKVDKEKIKAAKDALTEKWQGKTKETTGTVKNVEGSENRFTLTSAKGADMTVSVADASKITRHNKKGTLTDLQDGDAVTVKYLEKDGKNEAASVTVDEK